MGKIAFFEDKNFEGRRHECSSDGPDLRSYFCRCNSVKVESGCWVLYERPNYTGNQYILSPGEYPDPQQWMGFNDSIKSCRSIKNVYGKSWKIRFYEKKDFEGQAAECAEDCASVYEAFKFQEVHSSVVTDGAWVLYEQPDYHGRQYFLERGEYHDFTDWGATSPAVGSFRKITEF
ncbi:gamma-crystallin M2-like [Cyclopterus lumpus]|uniref:Beta/gamma crystallin 'Greek key' domain-containing protein n=1 Tax=Cyclopterus lumpus TaxID=8103 RepID=A0A8C3FXJ9_CYCLU|nr:gamma-crystallin M2-like [Cyclopterus lumpus]